MTQAKRRLPNMQPPRYDSGIMKMVVVHSLTVKSEAVDMQIDITNQHKLDKGILCPFCLAVIGGCVLVGHKLLHRGP